MTTSLLRKPRWFFYPVWVVLNTITIPVAFVVAMAIISLIEQFVGGTIQVNGQTRITEDYLGFYVFIPILGLLTGLVQVVLLQRYLPRLRAWVLATFLGWLLAFGGMLLLTVTLPPGIDYRVSLVMLVTALIGGIIALPQWWVLRTRLRQSSWWLLVNLLGWGLVGAVSGKSITSLFEMLVVGVIPAFATGVGCWLLLDRLAPPEQTNE